MLCLYASQIRSYLICGRRLQMLWNEIYLNRVCEKVYEIRVPSKYNWRSSSGDEWRPIHWEWRRTDMTEKNGLFVGNNINVNQNIGVRHRLPKAAMDKRFVSFMKWKESFRLSENLRYALEWTLCWTRAKEQQFCKTYSQRRELFRTNHFWRFDKVSDEIKPQNKNKKFRKNRSEFQPSFIINLFITVFTVAWKVFYWITK